MKDYVLKNKKGLLLVVLALLVTGLIEISNKEKDVQIYENLKYVTIESSQMHKITEEEIKQNFFNDLSHKIKFYAKTFRIDEEKLNSLLQDNYEELSNSDNLDLAIINYLFDLEKQEPTLFSKKIISSNPSKDYMLDLINYYCGIYKAVDFSLAASIARIESGYTAKYMISNNNIFGGMSGGKLIKYKTIEYGILKFIVLLNDRYYGKGLNTVETIGRVYNPVVGENGVKIASPTWVKNVKKSQALYQDITSINDIEVLVNYQNNAID